MKTLLIEGKTGRVLQVLDKLADIGLMPEILDFTAKSSDGPFYPAADADERFHFGEIVPLDFLLVSGKVTANPKVEAVLASDPTQAEVKATGFTLIVGIKGQYKVGDVITL